MGKIDIRVKELLRFDPEISDKEFMKSIKAIIRHVCKPCWEIKYCPYGPFVEEFPLMLLTSAEAKDEDIDPEDFPEEIPEEVRIMACDVFGHVCPVFFVSEGVTETAEPRRRGRFIPAYVKIRVARRDENTCQICSKHLKDCEIEFDHIIPVSKAGSSEESNIQVTCFKCNRDKSDKIEI